MDVDARPDWPEPVEAINEDGGSEIVLLCEHASNHLPLEYAGLGLGPSELQRHIAWDIGAADLTRLLASRLNAPAFLGTYSRLLIDLNRPLGSATSIPLRSEDTDIPGNVGIGTTERELRARLVFEPFHKKVAAHLDQRRRLKRPTRVLTIHSFTPIFLGASRPWHVGVLHGEADGFARAILRGLQADRALSVTANAPYIISRDDDYAVPIHGDDRGLPAALIEIRQDLLDSENAQKAWSARLAAILENLPSERTA